MRKALLLWLSLLASAGAQSERALEFYPTFGGAPLALDTLACETAAGQRIAVTRCDLLLSGVALQREDGAWIGPQEWFAYLHGGAGRAVLSGVPGARYRRLRFEVGLPPAVDRGDPAQYAAGHPLNPLVNGLHWGWQSGYVFAALEGRWRSGDGAWSGYSFHLARESMRVELAVALDLPADRAVSLALDVKALLDGVVLEPERLSTHSREGDALADKLRGNMSTAFRIERSTGQAEEGPRAVEKRALIAPNATPYRLTFPRVFPMPGLPRDNPLTNEGVALGEKLFHDTRLSGNQTQSCTSCHDPAAGFRDGRRFSIGAEGQSGTRRSMSLLNLAWKSAYFWDGRAPSLRAQVLEPIQGASEMHAGLPSVIERLKKDAGDDFAKAFGSPLIDADRIGRALEQYLLTLVAEDSRFDRAQRGLATLTSEEQRGFELFNTEYDPAHGRRGADCFHCHGGPLFRSLDFANNGLALVSPDEGRSAVTGQAGDRGKFSVPSLRNVALNAPYMHDGCFATLEEVIAHYDHGVARSETLDPNLAKHPPAGLGLSPADQQALAAFLRTLTDERFSSKIP